MESRRKRPQVAKRAISRTSSSRNGNVTGLNHKTFRAEIDHHKQKYYILDMFPYPSAAGLHVGHPEGYTATDILARYKRMRGCNVLHPMAGTRSDCRREQYAIETGTHPRETTARNITTFRPSDPGPGIFLRLGPGDFDL